MNKKPQLMSRFCKFKTMSKVVLLLSFFSSTSAFSSPDKSSGQLSLQHVLDLVKSNDLTMKRYSIDADALNEKAQSQLSLPDPVLFAAAQNLPTDTFKFDQEPMTQFRFGIRQKLPAGETLEIKSETISLKADQKHLMQELRWLRLKKSVEQAWYDAWYWQKALEVFDNDAVFLKQTLDITQSLYEVGKSNQSDVLGAELALIELEERRINGERNFLKFRNKLNTLAIEKIKPWFLASSPLNAYQNFERKGEQALLNFFSQHPELLLLEQSVQISKLGINLAKQDYLPKWGLEASYGLRAGEDAMGSDRPDFLSAGISVQIPLFSSHSQDSAVSSAKKRSDAAENAKLDALQNMLFEYRNAHQQFSRSLAQTELYESKILPKLEQQKESILIAYQSDRMDFNQVVMVYLKEQRLRLKFQRLLANQQQMLSKLNYWLPQQESVIAKENLGVTQ